MPSSVVPTFRKPRKVGQPICGGASEKLKVRQPPARNHSSEPSCVRLFQGYVTL